MSEKKRVNVRDAYRKYGIFAVLVILFIVASFLDENFLKLQNLLNILKQVTPAAIIGAGVTMLICSGFIDLSAGAVAGLAACVSAGVMAMTNSLFLGLLTAFFVGGVMSYINGLVITKLRLPAFIATLAMQNVAKGLALIYTGGAAIRGVERLRWLGQGNLFGIIPNLIVVMFGVLVFIQITMKNTRFGLYMYAVGGNRKAAITAGINTPRQIRMTYLLHGVLLGLAGVALNARMMAAHPNVGPGYEFDAITATVVGGTSFGGGSGSMFCVIIGSVIIGIINNLLILMGADASVQMIAKGVLIALAVAVDITTKGHAKD